MQVQGGSRRYGRLAAYGLAGLALIVAVHVVATSVLGVIQTYTALPYWDAWEQVTPSQQLDHLFEQHNEHRITTTRLVFIADELWSSGDNRLTLAVLLLVQAGMAALLVHLLARARRLDDADRIGAAAFALAMLFWFEQHETLTWPFTLQIVFVSLFAVASFAVLALNPHRYAAVLASLLAGASAFSMANGVAAPFLLVSLAIWMRRPSDQLAIVLTLGAVFVVLFFFDYQILGRATESLPQSVWHTARFALACLGGPFAAGAKALLGGRGAPPKSRSGSALPVFVCSRRWVLICLFAAAKHGPRGLPFSMSWHSARRPRCSPP